MDSIDFIMKAIAISLIAITNVNAKCATKTDQDATQTCIGRIKMQKTSVCTYMQNDMSCFPGCACDQEDVKKAMVIAGKNVDAFDANSNVGGVVGNACILICNSASSASVSTSIIALTLAIVTAIWM